MQVIEVAPVTDTGIYADNDVLFVATAVAAFGAGGKARKLTSVVLLDQSDQAQDVDLVFSQGSITIGAINGAVSISDADAQNVIGTVSVLIADYCDLINSQVATKRAIDLIVQPDATLYVSGVLRSGTPTYAADALVLKLGFEDVSE